MRSSRIAQGILLSALWWSKWEGNQTKGIYVHVEHIHLAAQQKLTQCCKATPLQLKNKKRMNVWSVQIDLDSQTKLLLFSWTGSQDTYDDV